MGWGQLKFAFIFCVGEHPETDAHFRKLLSLFSLYRFESPKALLFQLSCKHINMVKRFFFPLHQNASAETLDGFLFDLTDHSAFLGGASAAHFP